MLIAQISDLHCRDAEANAKLGIDNNGNATLAINRLNQLSPRPDLVIATGDLTSSGKVDQYQALDSILMRLEIPLYVIPGNHDERAQMLEVLSGQYGLVENDYNFVKTVIEGGDLRLVGLDTSISGHHQGGLPEDRISWLDEILQAESQKPTFIFMHHPPFETGIWWMDRLGIIDGLGKLEKVIGKHKQVIGLTAGHLHRSIHSTFAGIPVTVAPTTCYAVDLDINKEALPKVTDEPPAIMLHYWRADALISHTLFLQPHNVYDVSKTMMDWPGRRELMRNHLPVPKLYGGIE